MLYTIVFHGHVVYATYNRIMAFKRADQLANSCMPGGWSMTAGGDYYNNIGLAPYSPLAVNEIELDKSDQLANLLAGL